MMAQDENHNWSEENTAALVYFLENISGPWHPTQWQTMVDFISQIKEWDGENLPKVSPLNSARRSQLFIPTLLQAFIQSLMEADYFDDVNDFYKFMHEIQSDKVFSMFRFWYRLNCPIEERSEYWKDYTEQIFDFKNNARQDEDTFSNYSDEEIAIEMNNLVKKMEEE